MKSFAELSDDGMYWTLDGVKTWVVNATKADVFIVCMPTEVRNDASLGILLIGL